ARNVARSIAFVVTAALLMGASSAAADTPPDVRRLSDLVTVQTSAGHGLQAGDTVTISGVINPPNACGDAVAGTSFNGTFTVASVPSPTSFAFTQSGPDEIGQGGTEKRLNTRAIASIGRNNNTVVVVTSTAHGFVTGQMATIAGVGDASFNGTFSIQVVDASTFAYAQNGPNASPGPSGTATVEG